MSPELVGVIGSVGFVLMGIIFRLMWSGFQAKLVEALSASSLGKIVSGINEHLVNIQTDLNFVKAASQMGMSEVDRIRARFDAHLDEVVARNEELSKWRQEVNAFMLRWVT